VLNGKLTSYLSLFVSACITSQFYQRSVQKIAKTSLRAAIMTPHLFLGGIAVASKVLLPRFVAWLACETALLQFFKGLYPLAASILLLHDKKLLQNESPPDDPKSPHRSKRGRNPGTPKSKEGSKPKEGVFSSPSFRRMFPRTTPASEKRGQPQHKSEAADLEEREAYWLQFWMVSAAFQAFKSLLFVLPVTGSVLSRYEWCGQVLDQLELFFYIWIYAIPYLLPQLPGAPEGRPMVILAPIIGQTACSIFKAMDVCTDAFWQAWVVRWVGLFLDVAAMARLVSRASVDRCRDVVAHSKSLLVPAATLTMPRFISVFGLLFVQYCLPLQKQHKNSSDNMLRYWALHCIVTYLVERFSGMLWWIPLSRAVVFSLYLLLGLSPGVVEACFNMLQHDLEAFRILSPSDPNSQRTIDDSWSARSVHAIIQRLPRAEADAAGEKLEESNEDAPAEEPDVSRPAEESSKVHASPAVESVEIDNDDDSSNFQEPDDALFDPSDDDKDSVERDDAASTESEDGKDDKPPDKENLHNNNKSLRRSNRTRRKPAQLS
jgi:hypothetical protein